MTPPEPATPKRAPAASPIATVRTTSNAVAVTARPLTSVVCGTPLPFFVPSRVKRPFPLPRASIVAPAPMWASTLLLSICSATAMPPAFCPTAMPPATEMAVTSSVAETRMLPFASTIRGPLMYALMSCATMLIEIEPPSAKLLATAAPTVTLMIRASNGRGALRPMIRAASAVAFVTASWRPRSRIVAPSILSITYVPSFSPALEIVIVLPAASVVSVQSARSSRTIRSKTDVSEPVSATNWIFTESIAGSSA